MSTMWQTEVNPMSIRMFTGSKTPATPACSYPRCSMQYLQERELKVLSRGMPLTWSICGEVDQHELGTMIRLDPM